MDIVSGILFSAISVTLKRSIIEILASKLPKSERFVIPGVTHELGLSSKPDVFNSYVLAFLQKN